MLIRLHIYGYILTIAYSIQKPIEKKNRLICLYVETKRAIDISYKFLNVLYGVLYEDS